VLCKALQLLGRLVTDVEVRVRLVVELRHARSVAGGWR
jgi:hypothetical protein